MWVTNHLANPVLRPLLRGRAGQRLGRHLAVLRYRGNRTGAEHELIVQYARDGDHVWIVPGRPERKTWWRNLRTAAPVEIWLAGEHHHGTAAAIDGRDHPSDVVDALGRYLTALPRAAKGLGLDDEPNLTTIAPRFIVVRVDIGRGARAHDEGATP